MPLPLFKISSVDRQKVHINFGVIFTIKKTFFWGGSGEVFPHLLACSIVQIGSFWCCFHRRTPPNSIWAPRYSSSKMTCSNDKIHMFHTMGFYWILSEFDHPIDFGELYLGAQMEFGGVLWWKQHQNHPIWTIEQGRRCGNTSSEPPQKKDLFFVIISK